MRDDLEKEWERVAVGVKGTAQSPSGTQGRSEKCLLGLPFLGEEFWDCITGSRMLI